MVPGDRCFPFAADLPDRVNRKMGFLVPVAIIILPWTSLTTAMAYFVLVYQGKHDCSIKTFGQQCPAEGYGT